jgi:hypothetical protein
MPIAKPLPAGVARQFTPRAVWAGIWRLLDKAAMVNRIVVAGGCSLSWEMAKTHGKDTGMTDSIPTGGIGHPDRRRSGAAAAELALIIPLLSLMLFGALQYGFLIYTSNAMTTSARNGARLIAFDQNRATAEAEVRRGLPGWVAAAATISTVENDNGVARITVTVPGASAAILGLAPMPAQISVVGSMPRVADR